MGKYLFYSSRSRNRQTRCANTQKSSVSTDYVLVDHGIRSSNVTTTVARKLRNPSLIAQMPPREPTWPCSGRLPLVVRVLHAAIQESLLEPSASKIWTPMLIKKQIYSSGARFETDEVKQDNLFGNLCHDLRKISNSQNDRTLRSSRPRVVVVQESNERYRPSCSS